MDTQEFFTTGFTGLQAQGFRRAFAIGQGCLYRGPEDTKCFVGQCIPDSQYLPEMDRRAWTPHQFLEHGMFQDVRLDVFGACQEAHDSNPHPEDMEAELRKVAEHFGLTVPT